MSRAQTPPDDPPWRSIKVGDVVIRMLGGAPMNLAVSAVDEQLIECGGPHGWHFARDTGWEVDDEIGWGPAHGMTGSYLLPPGALDGDIPDARNPERRPVPDRVVFRTETGSRYEVDNVARTWRRTPTLASGVLRSEEGALLDPVRPILGWPVTLVGPVNPDGVTHRTVVTTPVVAIEHATGPTPKRGRRVGPPGEVSR
ncbi:MAG TPA: hypothetical protein VKR30_01105 [Candidatus Limnocylindrales bacterium]|nr:hypothetical protein [Candidatus Limnocylindrales bacterium]